MVKLIHFNSNRADYYINPDEVSSIQDNCMNYGSCIIHMKNGHKIILEISAEKVRQELEDGIL